MGAEVAVSILLLAFVCACSPVPGDGSPGKQDGGLVRDPEVVEDDDDTGDDTGTDVEPLDWFPCDPDLHLPAAVRCAEVLAPLRWSAPDTSLPISLTLMKISATGPPRGQLWMLDGGPGGTGLQLVRDLERYAPLTDAGWTLMVPVHRGTGESTALEMALPRTPTHWLDSWIDTYGDDVVGFSATEAADDLAMWLHRSPGPGANIVWGMSYGSFLAQRFAQRHDGLVDGIVLDGVLPLDADIERVHVRADAPVRAMVALCAADPSCAAQTGGDPEGVLMAALDGVEDRRCPVIVGTREDWEAGFSGTMGSVFAPLVFPLATMIVRCDADDETALHTFQDVLGSYQQPQVFNAGLQVHVTMLDLFRPTSTLAEVEAAEDGVLLPGPGPAALYGLQERWAELGLPDYPRAVGTISTPVLVLQGALDPATPPVWAEEVLPDIVAPITTLVTFPYAGHVSFGFTASADSSDNCALDVLLAFAEAPGRAPPTDCVADTLPPDFGVVLAATQARSLELFGTTDPWRTGDGTGAAVAPPASP